MNSETIQIALRFSAVEIFWIHAVNTLVGDRSRQDNLDFKFGILIFQRSLIH
jgi:hypothetical protein